MSKSLTNIILVIFSLLSGLLATEFAMRYLLENRLALHLDERNLTYRYDSELGWFPIENSKKTYTASRTISVEHNSRGFRDPEHIVSDKPRIVFLGDSFVWGLDVESNERFIEKLRIKIPEWSIYNLGVSGYGTDQELMILMKHYDYYRPDIIFLLFCTDNDDYDNTHNMVYNGYYKPYFTLEQGNLQLRGTPVPKSENYYLYNHDLLSKSYCFRLIVRAYYSLIAPASIEVKNLTPALILTMNNLAKSRGAQLIVGSTDSHPGLADILSAINISYVDLSNSHRYPGYGAHWTPAGHSLVSEKIFDFLKQGGYLTAHSQSTSSIKQYNNH